MQFVTRCAERVARRAPRLVLGRSAARAGGRESAEGGTGGHADQLGQREARARAPERRRLGGVCGGRRAAAVRPEGLQGHREDLLARGGARPGARTRLRRHLRQRDREGGARA